MAGFGLCSTLKQEHSKLARVEDVERVIGLTCDLEAEAFTHDAVEAVSILPIHLFFHNLASHLQHSKETVTKMFCQFQISVCTYLDVDTSGARCLLDAVSNMKFGFVLNDGVHVSVLNKAYKAIKLALKHSNDK